MKKELEALGCLKIYLETLLERANHDELLFRKDTEFCENFLKENQQYHDSIKQALQRLETIDNANPSEALEAVKQIEFYVGTIIGLKFVKGNDVFSEAKKQDYEIFERKCNTIQQALIQAEQDKKKLNKIEKLTNLLYSERRKIGQEYVKWCKENNAVFNDETNMITWVLAIKLKEVLYSE